MPRRYARTYRRSSAWDARADAKRAAAEAAGIPVRDDADCRAPITLDLSCVGGDCLMLEPCRGKVAWRERLQDVAHNGALGAVFPNRQGNPYTDGGFAAMWGKLMREAVAAGVVMRRFAFHDLRAHYTTEHKARTGALPDLHASPTTTARVYERSRQARRSAL